jgi:sugar phosphate isomerase/epimerase
MIRSKGATLVALSADVGGRRLADPATLDGNLQRLREALQLAADLGAACLVVTGGYIPPPSPAPAAQASEDQAARAALTEGARAIANFAASCCARVCWQAGSEPPAVLAEFLSQADPGGLLAVDLNPGAYVMRGHDPLQALQALAARIGVVRAADCYRGGGEALFGQGDVRWGELIVGLATLQRQTPVSLLAGCSLECDRAAALTAAYRRLVALRGNPMG